MGGCILAREATAAHRPPVPPRIMRLHDMWRTALLSVHEPSRDVFGECSVRAKHGAHDGCGDMFKCSVCLLFFHKQCSKEFAESCATRAGEEECCSVLPEVFMTARESGGICELCMSALLLDAGKPAGSAGPDAMDC